MADRHYDAAFDAWERARPSKSRRLRRGEHVSIPQLGIPHATISGEGIHVVEYEDGTISPIIANPEGLLAAVMRALVFDSGRALSGAEAAFIRRRLGLTQVQLAAKLGVARETLSKYENSTEIAPDISNAIRYFGLVDIIEASGPKGSGLGAGTLDELRDGIHQHTKGKRANRGLQINFPAGSKARIQVTA